MSHERGSIRGRLTRKVTYFGQVPHTDFRHRVATNSIVYDSAMDQRLWRFRGSW